jgi:PilZ domain
MHAAATVELIDTIPERRAGVRHIAVMLIAKLSHAHTHTICRIRNISAMGARLETGLNLATGQLVSLELRSDLQMTGRIMWTRNGNAGVQFDAPIDVRRYLMRPENKIDRIRARAPRYRCIADAIVLTDDGCLSCKITDIGLSGAGLIELPDLVSFRQGQILKLKADGISSHHASVAWVANKRAGIKFRHPLKYTELQDWLNDCIKLPSCS